MRIRALKRRFAVARLEPESPIPKWARGDFVSMTRTPEELSIIVEEARLPAGCPTVERGWRVLAVAGPIDFSEIGVLLALAGPLAASGVSMFALSTYDTDYVLVKEDDLAVAIETLRSAGHHVDDSGP